VSDAAEFAGRFHPLVVHFPIALLLLAGLLRLIGRRQAPADESGGAWRRSTRLVVAIAALAGLATAGTGWLLGASGGYAGTAFLWHQRLGIALAVTTTLALVAMTRPGRRWRRAEPLLLAAAIALMVPASHLGATLTHGDGYLTDHAPPWFKQIAGGFFGSSSGERLAGLAPERIGVYAELVAPVLETHCVSCHGPVKVEGGLRLDSTEGLSKGGDGGPVIAAGHAVSSELVRRIYLPASHEDAMPPRGHPRLSPADAALVRWWVDGGADFELTLADADVSPEVLPAIEALTGPLQRGGPTLPDIAVAEAPPDAVAQVTARGFSVVRIVEGRAFLHVHSANAAGTITDASLDLLDPIAQQVLWLDLGRTRISDQGLEKVARLPNLTRLHLQQTLVGDAGLSHLAALERLEYLNLYGTAITDEGLMKLSSLTRLRALYVWRTSASAAGVSRLQAALPRLRVETGVSAIAEGARPE
jgi:uncharacterized membrane protein